MNTFRSIVDSLPGCIMLVVAILILIGQIYSCLLAFRMYYVNRKNGFIRPVLYVIWVAVGIVMLTFFLDGRYYAEYTGTPRIWNPLTEFMYQLPWVLVLFTEAVLVLLVVISIQTVVHYSRKNITPIVIKEAVDFLPIGILFADSKGHPAFSNRMINDFSKIAFRESLTDTNRFLEHLKSIGEEQDGQYLVSWNEHSYLFQIQETTVKGKNYEQISVSDVTEATRITKELQEKNRRLLDMQLRMKTLAIESGDLAMEQEILNARRAVHDNLGYTLARGAYYMKQGDSKDAAGVLKLLQSVNDTLIYETEQPEELYHPVEDAIRLSSGIGIRVDLQGKVPESEHLEELIGQAIRECAANTFKHAQGDCLTCTITEEERVRIDITNNGKAPEEEIRPSGGLRSLMKSVNRLGGEMKIESEPGFRLIIEVPDVQDGE